MSNNYENVISKTRVRLARNACNTNFPHMLAANNPATRMISNAVMESAKALYSDASGVTMNELSPASRAYLVESRLISRELAGNTASGAVVTADEYRISAMINEEDHLRLQCVVDGFDLEEAYQKVAQFDDEIGKRLKYAYDEKLGYLTVCPTNLGTGMRASVMMFLPALTIEKKINTVIKNCNLLGLTVRGAMGEGSEAEAFLYQLSNQKTLGVSESDILKLVDKVASELAEMELKERVAILKKYGMRLEDKIMRAYGELKYARMLSTKELMDKIGYVKLGATIGLIDVSPSDIDRAVESAQPAHVMKTNGKELSETDRDIKRAEIIGKIL